MSEEKTCAITLKADMTSFRRQVDELTSLGLEAGDLPQTVLKELRGLADNIGEELTLSRPMTASGAGKHVVKIGFREGGRFDRCAAALRAFRDRNKGHGSLRDED